MKKLIIASLLAVMPMFAFAATEITEANADKELAAPGLQVLKIYADWCPACQQLKPIFNDAEIKYGNKVRFLELDVDKNPGIQVQAIPVIVFMKDGKVLAAVPGAPPNQKAFDDLLEKVLLSEQQKVK